MNAGDGRLIIPLSCVRSVTLRTILIVPVPAIAKKRLYILLRKPKHTFIVFSVAFAGKGRGNGIS